MNELITISTTGSTVYALIYDGGGNVWDTVGLAFVSYVPSNQTRYAVTMTEGSPSGYFYGNFPPAITAAGLYNVEARQQAGGSPASSDPTISEGQIEWDGSGEVTGGTSYATSSYIAAYLGISTSSLLDSLAVAASAAIDNYCRRPQGFWSATYTEDYEGTDDWTLQLRQHPVTSVSQVVYNAYDTNPSTVAGSNYFIDQRSGQITIKPSVSMVESYFFSGPLIRHQVTYTAGYAVIPADIQQACAMICKRMYQHQGTGLMTASEKIGDYQGNYTLSQAVIDNDWGIQALLNKYRDLCNF